jgi:hypothetical protein
VGTDSMKCKAGSWINREVGKFMRAIKNSLRIEEVIYSVDI